MIVKQKQYEIDCNKYAEVFNITNQWGNYCISKDAWLAGYKRAKENSLDMDKIVEIDIGSNQIGMNDKFNSRDKEQLLREFLTLHFEAKDIRITKDCKGNISFQGTL